jgi:hypothetical protein
MNEDLPPETVQFLADLSREDIHTLRAGLPLIRMVIGFGKVTRWLVITLAGIFLGGVMLWDGVLKIISWMRGHG